MCLTEYNEAETMEMFKEEGRAEGEQAGTEKALTRSVKNLMKNLGFTVEQAMDSLEIPADQRSIYAGLVSKP